MTSIRLKMLAATLSGAGLLTMGALTVALGNTQAHATPPTSGETTATTVQTTAPSAPTIPVATPTVKAQKFVGKDWNGQ